MVLNLSTGETPLDEFVVYIPFPFDDWRGFIIFYGKEHIFPEKQRSAGSKSAQRKQPSYYKFMTK
jgi:hypothetical protein